MILRFLIGLVIIYALFGLMLYVFQSSFIYYPDNTDFYECDYFFDDEKIDYKGTKFYFKNESNEVVIIYHGNAGRACDRKHMLSFLPENYSYVFVEYTGYADVNKKPSKELILKDVENVAEYFKNEKVHLIGESIGSSVASYHASISDNVESLIMIAPFYSLERFAKNRYFMYPVSLLLKENYDTAYYLKNYNKSSLIIHGTRDNIIPQEQSEMLYTSLAGSKERVLIEKAGHNNIYLFQETKNEISDFLNKN